MLKFVNLHAHSVFSSYDGFGYPNEHMDAAIENGLDAHALTDHGSMNGMSYQFLHHKKLKKEGKEFKPIYGVEAYCIPSFEQWREDYKEISEQKEAKKAAKKDAMSEEVEFDEEERNKLEFKNKIKSYRHVVLLAKNQKGLENIFKLVSESNKGDHFYRFPRLDFDLIEKYSEGVVCLSACLGGILAVEYWQHHEDGLGAVKEKMIEVAQRFKNIFNEDFFLELQWNAVPEQHIVNLLIVDIAKELEIELVSTADCHYPRQEDWRYRDAYKRLRWISKNESVEFPESVDEIGYELYIKNGQQMFDDYKRYSGICEATYDDQLILDSIERTYRIAHEVISDFSPNNEIRLPAFVVPEGTTAEEELDRLVIDGYVNRGFTKDDGVYMSRLLEELDIIKSKGFAKYFLTMNAVAKMAKSIMLSGVARGSAGGSLVSYCLGITDLEPIRHNLQFSRFMTKTAKGYPDIDFDVSDAMLIKEILASEWGENNVIPITNYSTLKLRSLIKDISKMHGIPFKETNVVTSVMEEEAKSQAMLAAGVKTGMYIPDLEELKLYSPSLQAFFKKYPFLEEFVEKLYGQIRSRSRHAGGVIIADNLDQFMPLTRGAAIKDEDKERRAKMGISPYILQTPWSEGQNVRHLEPLGFIKFDLLGLSTLKVFEGCIKNILKGKNGRLPTFDEIKEFYDEFLHPDRIDFDDQEVYENVFWAGKWAGIFQMDNSGMQNFCLSVKPKNLIDICAVSSIYRPGPLEMNTDKQYVQARERGYVEYSHELIKEVTESTYGFLIFQEQIAELAHKLGNNISLDEGNDIRKQIIKKGKEADEAFMTEMKKRFLEGCAEKNVPGGENLWHAFEAAGAYSFNLSHAMGYSMITFQCAWFLNYYPLEWLAAFLDQEPEGKKEVAITTVKSFGYNIEKSDINKSGPFWEIDRTKNSLIQPLMNIKGVGLKALEEIIKNRPYVLIEDVILNKNIDGRRMNKRVISALAKAGALNGVLSGDKRFESLKHMWLSAIENKPKTLKKLDEQITVFAGCGDFTSQELIEFQTELTGIYPISEVISLDKFAKFDELGIEPLGNYEENPFADCYWSIIRSQTNHKTGGGKDYAIIDTIDTTFKQIKIKVWNWNPRIDSVEVNAPYMMKVDHSPQWGYSIKNFSKNCLKI